jgi:glycerate kinase
VVRVLVAPDKFRGTLSAPQAASAIAAGWLRARPTDQVVEMPLADGGEGTLDALVGATEGGRRRMVVEGPLGDPVEAEWGWLGNADPPIAVVEMSRASGLELLAPDRRDAMRSSTFGTGELILAASREAVDEVIVCIGGSASTDGGAGMAQALGVRLLDASGRQIGRGGESLLDLVRIDLTTLDPAVRRTRFLVASDVDNPLLGSLGAAHAYGPQKGASAEEVLVLDRALGHLAAVVYRDLMIDVRHVHGAGAAGGLGAGLVAFLGAKVRPGVEIVMGSVGFTSALMEADLVITGEGAFDERSIGGKVPGGVMSAALGAGIRVVVLCGRAEVHASDVVVASLVERFGRTRALREAGGALEDLAALVAADV